jgi:hypothetical protein
MRRVRSPESGDEGQESRVKSQVLTADDSFLRAACLQGRRGGFVEDDRDLFGDETQPGRRHVG